MDPKKNTGGLLAGFQAFILRGNVVDLAVGVIIGAAFGGIVTALVKDLITPLIAAIGSQPDFSALSFTIRGSKFMYGDFLNALLSFVIQALTVYFAIVIPINALLARVKREQAAAPAAPSASETYLREIRDSLAKR